MNYLPHFQLKDKALLFPITVGFILLTIIFLIAYKGIEQSNIPAPDTVIQPTPVTIKNDSSGSPTFQAKKAVSVIESLKEVQDFKQSITATNSSKFATEIDSSPTAQGNFYVIRVYEVVPHGDGTAHSATYGWYRFYPKTGAITKQNPSQAELWDIIKY